MSEVALNPLCFPCPPPCLPSSLPSFWLSPPFYFPVFGFGPVSLGLAGGWHWRWHWCWSCWGWTWIWCAQRDIGSSDRGDNIRNTRLTARKCDSRVDKMRQRFEKATQQVYILCDIRSALCHIYIGVSIMIGNKILNSTRHIGLRLLEIFYHSKSLVLVHCYVNCDDCNAATTLWVCFWKF